MKHIKKAFFTIIAILLMIPLTLSGVPHEPSPAGGGWLELDPELPRVQSESPWFPNYSGAFTLEAWIYIEEPPGIQEALSLVGKTNRFNWAILGHRGDSNFDGVRDATGGILIQQTKGASGMVAGHLPAKQWLHYVGTIDGGATVGINGFVSGMSSGRPLATVRNPLLLGGIPVLTEIAFPNKEKTLPASGVYLDELRISRGLRYTPGEDYTVPTEAFTPDADTLGLYHFDEKSPQRHKDASKHQLDLIRKEESADSQSGR